MTEPIDPPLSCDGCGVCCEEQGLPPEYAVPALLLHIPEALRNEIALHQEEERQAGRTRHERGLPCIWYDAETKKCRHYEYRPDICREVPIGGSSCLFWRERRMVPRSILSDFTSSTTPFTVSDLPVEEDEE